MKRTLLAIFLVFIFQISRSQEKNGRVFFLADVNFTLGINEHYQIGPDDDNGPLIVPSALFFRFGLGYTFRKRVAIAMATLFLKV